MINEAGNDPNITSGKKFRVPTSRTPKYLQVGSNGIMISNRNEMQNIIDSTPSRQFLPPIDHSSLL